MGNKKKRKGPPQPEPSGRETMRRMHAEDARADRLAAESKQASYRSLEPPTRFELDDDPSRDSVSFGLVSKQQQRIRERQRRDILREERRLRELDEEVDREVNLDLRRRIREGDLRERVVSEVLARLKTPEVEAQIAQRSEAAIAARRAELLDALEAERVARVAARRAEEQRLEEAARLESILAENAARGGGAAQAGGGDRSAAQGARARARDAAPCARKAKFDRPHFQYRTVLFDKSAKP